MIRSSLFVTASFAIASTASAQVTNGNFDLAVPSNGTGNGWTTIHVDGAGGWRSGGGNPGGFFILNDNGNDSTDPTISQTLTGLTIGAEYLIAGEYITVYASGGPTVDCFGVLLDDVTILSLNDPGPVFTPFSVSFIATSDTQTFSLASERNGSDYGHGVDNISVTLVPAPGAGAIALAGLMVWRRRR